MCVSECVCGDTYGWIINQSHSTDMVIYGNVDTGCC